MRLQLLERKGNLIGNTVLPATHPRIGDVYLMQFEGTGSEQSGSRPGIVFQNNPGNLHSPNIIALPLTSAVKRLDIPTHVFIRAADSGLRKDSVVLCENPQRMSKERLIRFMFTMPDHYMKQIARASLIATSSVSYLSPQELLEAWQTAVQINRESALKEVGLLAAQSHR